MPIILILVVIIVIAALSGLKQINEYERGVVYTLGHYTGMMGPGLHVVWPFIQVVRKIDIRTKAEDVPKQETITRDNVSCKMNAVIYYRIVDPSKAINEVENVYQATSQLAQTTMRRIAGEVTLDELLSSREKIAEKILESVEHAASNWGVDVQSVELKDVELPENMVRTMAKQAEAEREKRATIINAEAEVAAAENLSHAAALLASTPGALHLRTLSSINDISSDQSNTVVFAVPLEVLRALEGVGQFLGQSDTPALKKVARKIMTPSAEER